MKSATKANFVQMAIFAIFAIITLVFFLLYHNWWHFWICIMAGIGTWVFYTDKDYDEESVQQYFQRKYGKK